MISLLLHLHKFYRHQRAFMRFCRQIRHFLNDDKMLMRC